MKTITYTIRKNPHDEWVVRVRLNGRLYAQYFATDKADAVATCAAIIATLKEYHQSQ